MDMFCLSLVLYLLKIKTMAKVDFIERHLIIIDLLSNKPRNFNQIRSHLLRCENIASYQLDISQKTFKRDCHDILRLWGVEIQYNKKSLVYEIVENYQDTLIDRAIESYNIISALQKKDKIGKYFFLERRKSSGSQYFNGLIYAIENKLIITFDHTSYWKEPSKRKCIAKAIKESQNRFYLIAYDLNKKEFRNFGLDRITNLKITTNTTSSPNIDVEETYKNAFGIECYEKPTKIILEFDNEQKQYIQSLALHDSQRIILEQDNTFRLELFIHPTNDFILEIMKHGPNCEVIEPLSLREQVKHRVMALYNIYNDK